MKTMKLFLQRTIGRLTVLSLGIAASVISHSSEASMTVPVMHDARPLCIARFSIDVPRTAQVYNQQFKYMNYAIETSPNVSHEVFEKRLADRENVLRTSKRMDMAHLPNTTKNAWLQQSLKTSDNSRLFIFTDGDSETVAIPYDVEGYAWAGNSMFTLKNTFAKTYDETDLRTAEQILPHIRPRGEWEVPDDGAFCFNGGAISGKPMPSFDATVAVGLVAGRPSNLIVEMRESVDADQKASLLKGLAGFEAKLKPYANHYKVLRKDKRDILGQEAEELLVQIQEGGIEKYQFYLFAPGVPGDASKPNTAIQLLFGATQDAVTPATVATSPVTEGQAIQTWDALVNSIRYRGISK
ncbi:T6SS immunity protein Tli4 family protein [Burkholderia glumae]|uniref:T6SS immunity protein Tli4 family protein n=1 Tax=Burkholderia glumae TaxID=337 RepID=UPI002151FB24|nr:T6SS immunity protein Tli4 family protein [Burkholderia glumae]